MDWQCRDCTLINTAAEAMCDACGLQQPSASTPKAASEVIDLASDEPSSQNALVPGEVCPQQQAQRQHSQPGSRQGQQDQQQQAQQWLQRDQQQQAQREQQAQQGQQDQSQQAERQAQQDQQDLQQAQQQAQQPLKEGPAEGVMGKGASWPDDEAGSPQGDSSQGYDDDFHIQLSGITSSRRRGTQGTGGSGSVKQPAEVAVRAVGKAVAGAAAAEEPQAAAEPGSGSSAETALPAAAGQQPQQQGQQQQQQQQKPAVLLRRQQKRRQRVSVPAGSVTSGSPRGGTPVGSPCCQGPLGQQQQHSGKRRCEGGVGPPSPCRAGAEPAAPAGMAGLCLPPQKRQRLAEVGGSAAAAAGSPAGTSRAGSDGLASQQAGPTCQAAHPARTQQAPHQLEGSRAAAGLSPLPPRHKRRRRKKRRKETEEGAAQQPGGDSASLGAAEGSAEQGQQQQAMAHPPQCNLAAPAAAAAAAAGSPGNPSPRQQPPVLAKELTLPLRPGKLLRKRRREQQAQQEPQQAQQEQAQQNQGSEELLQQQLQQQRQAAAAAAASVDQEQGERQARQQAVSIAAAVAEQQASDWQQQQQQVAADAQHSPQEQAGGSTLQQSPLQQQAGGSPLHQSPQQQQQPLQASLRLPPRRPSAPRPPSGLGSSSPTGHTSASPATQQEQQRQQQRRQQEQLLGLPSLKEEQAGQAAAPAALPQLGPDAWWRGMAAAYHQGSAAAPAGNQPRGKATAAAVPAAPVPAWVRRERQSAQDITPALLAAAAKCPHVPLATQRQRAPALLVGGVPALLAFKVASQLPEATACRNVAELLQLGGAAAAAAGPPPVRGSSLAPTVGAAQQQPQQHASEQAPALELDMGHAARRLLAAPRHQAQPVDLAERTKRWFTQRSNNMRKELRQRLEASGVSIGIGVGKQRGGSAARRTVASSGSGKPRGGGGPKPKPSAAAAAAAAAGSGSGLTGKRGGPGPSRLRHSGGASRASLPVPKKATAVASVPHKPGCGKSGGGGGGVGSGGGAAAPGATQYAGVRLSQHGTYTAYVWAGTKQIWLGTFSTLQSGARAVDLARLWRWVHRKNRQDAAPEFNLPAFRYTEDDSLMRSLLALPDHEAFKQFVKVECGAKRYARDASH